MTTRYNSFNQIHKGLRALMYDTAMQLQQSDLSNGQCPVIAQVEEVLYLFEGHAQSEDQFFNEPLEKKDPEVSKLFIKEHIEDHRLGSILNDLLSQWKTASRDEERAEIGRSIFYMFNEFIAFNLYHMNKEEFDLNESLWKHYTDEEIKTTERTLVQNVPPAKMAKMVKWMVKGVNDTELYRWLQEVQLTAPTPVFNLIYGTAKTELNETRFNSLKEKLDMETIKSA